jgi:MoxR-like ATPase
MPDAMTERDIQQHVERLQQLKGAIARAVVGQAEVVEQLLIGLLAGGHCMLEGVPGLGKTLLVRTLGRRSGSTSTASSSRPT